MLPYLILVIVAIQPAINLPQHPNSSQGSKELRKKKGINIAYPLPVTHHLLLPSQLHVLPATSNVQHSSVHTGVQHIVTSSGNIPVYSQTVSHSSTNITHPTQIVPIQHNLQNHLSQHNLVSQQNLQHNLVSQQNLQHNLVSQQNLQHNLVSQQNLQHNLVSQQNLQHNLVSQQNLQHNLVSQQNLQHNLVAQHNLIPQYNVFHDLSVIPLHRAQKFGYLRVEKKAEDREDVSRFRTIFGGFGNGLYFGGHGAGHGFYAYGK